MEKKIVVIGGGIAGLTASITAAENGDEVLLIESSSSIGGMLERLDTWFIDDACGMCQILPQFSSDEKLDRCLRRDFYHPKIKIKTLTKLEKAEETEEGMLLTLKRKPRYVDEIKCIGCQLCEEVCPEEAPDIFDKGLTKHKAIHTLYKGSLTKSYYIDKNICTECGKCVEVCPTKAIDLNQKESLEKVLAKSVVITAGFSEIDPSTLTSFGYGRFKNVLTSLDFERLISRTGLHPEELKRPSDGKTPQKVALIQCVGSRDKERAYCSSACCMYAIKEARKIKQLSKETDVSIFYMDIRTFGKGHYRYYTDTEKMGVTFKNFRIPSVTEDSEHNIIIKYEENGKIKIEKYDLIILSTGQEIKEDTKNLLDAIRVKHDEYGFITPEDFQTVRTSKSNVFAAGSIIEPKDIENSVIEARAAGFLASTKKWTENKSEDNEQVPIDYNIAKFAIFICTCGGTINKFIDTKKIKESMENYPGVVLVKELDLICQDDKLKKITETIKNNGITRVIFATCSPAKYEILIRNAISRIGFNQAMLEIFPLREQVAWAYDSNGEDIAIQRIKAIVEKMRFAVPLDTITAKGTPRAAVIGGGLTGMTAAISLSSKGVKVELIEKSEQLGGTANNLSTTLEGENVSNYIKELSTKINDDSNITVYYNSEVTGFSGSAGNFNVEINTQEDVKRLPVGAIIIATGAEEYKPTEYLYGKDKRIITQLELEKRFLDTQSEIQNLKSIVMIQCVGSRNDEHPWCSKVCCSDAIKNALKLKEKNKDINITILYRDIMTYGKKELKYTEAREKGINFIKFTKSDEPRVTLDENGKIIVKTNDTVLSRELQFEPDLLVLSTGIVPRNNKNLSEILGVSLDDDGFFSGSNPKFRPLESEKAGIFFAGLCRSPEGIRDATAEAIASAGMAYQFLRKTTLTQRRTISEVIERWCGGCKFCIDACPYDARYFDNEKKVVKVRELDCVGCGNCVSVCPSGATKLRGSKDKQMLVMIDASI